MTKQATTLKSRILPETGGNVFCAEVAARITLEDYKTTFEPSITDMLTKYGEARLFLKYEGDFIGWDFDAACYDLSQILDKGSKIKKIALINPPENVVTRWNTMKPLFGGEVRIFSDEQSAEALAWLKK